MTEFAPDPVQDDEPLPVAVIDDMLGDVLAQLEAADELVIEHRRAAGDDHHTIARYQDVSARIGVAWAAVLVARTGLRPMNVVTPPSPTVTDA